MSASRGDRLTSKDEARYEGLLRTMSPSPPTLESDSAKTPAKVNQLLTLALAFLRLGCVSFGGPVAHLGYLRSEFVDKRKWLDDARYGDLVALCQFLPGPASSQVVFALGMLRAGFLGALIASVCFTLPAACLMVSFGYGAAHLSDLGTAKWLHGLKLAAVGVVAQAVWGMGKKLCTDRARITVCVAAAATVLLFAVAVSQLVVIVVGGLVGVLVYHQPAHEACPTARARTIAHVPALVALALCALLLVVLPLLAAATQSRSIELFDSFYRSGALVFGGGHVVLPLLRNEVVPHDWLTDDQFLAGYGAVQASPGPMFTFAAYLGTAIGTGDGNPDWRTGLWCLFGIFLPAWLLIGGALPFWDRLRAQGWAQAALAGANASVVGVLLAALYNPVFSETVHGRADVIVVLGAFLLLEHWKVAPLIVVLAAAIAGQLGVAEGASS